MLNSDFIFKFFLKFFILKILIKKYFFEKFFLKKLWKCRGTYGESPLASLVGNSSHTLLRSSLKYYHDLGD